jgi:hypothetical protein
MIVLHNLGMIAIILSVLVLIPATVAAFYGETSGLLAFVLTSLIGAFLGFVMVRIGAKGEILHRGLLPLLR